MAKVERIDEEETGSPLLRIQFGSSVASIMSGGNIVVKKSGRAASWLTTDPDELTRLTEATGITVQTNPESIPVAAIINDTVLPAGCGVIVGGADVGKTPVLRAIAETLGAQAAFIRFGEPLPGYMTDEDEASEALILALIDPKIKVVCVDSIKDLVASMDGAAMARGIPRVLFKMISQWGAIAASLGKLIIFPLNISTDSAEAIKEVEAAVQSNATLSVFFNSKTSDSVNFTALARTGEGRLRERSVWTMSYKDNVPKLVIRGERSAKAGRGAGDQSETAMVPALLSSYVIKGAVSRALSMNMKDED